MARVWYSAWQMECCGEPFSVNDTVEWELTSVPDLGWLEAVIGSDLAAQVTHQEDHHDLDEGANTRTGRVRSIRCAYSRYAPARGGDTRTLFAVPGTAEIRSAERVDGTEAGRGELHFNGYLVEIDLLESS
jgi:hypothetical protein